jgi:MoxR-like ATPase
MLYHQIPLDARRHPGFLQAVQDFPGLIDGKEQARVTQFLRDNEAFYAAIDYRDVIRRIDFLKEDISHHLINRESIVEQSIRALLTGEHQFIFSAAGVAKSLLANQLFSYIKNPSVFSIQFGPDTTPDDLFGGYDLERFKKGEIFHNIEGSIITKPFAFLDEFMDANDKILRVLLGVLLERRFINGNQAEPALLHTAIATSNFLRRSETTQALLDRFLYKSFINPKKDMFTLMLIGKVYNENSGDIVQPPKDQKIDLRELVHLRNIVHNRVADTPIFIPPEVEYLKNMVAASFETEMKKYRDNYYLSPRTITKSNDLLRVNAMLRGDTIANTDDIKNLLYLFAVLNEPLDSASAITSEELFTRVAQKRLQYFNAIKQDIVPILYITDYLQNAQKDPELLKQPLEFIGKKAEKSLLKSFLDNFRGGFKSDASSPATNRDSIIAYLEGIKSNYSEITDFKNKAIAFTKRVFR